jgi:hypothetical protein
VAWAFSCILGDGIHFGGQSYRKVFLLWPLLLIVLKHRVLIQSSPFGGKLPQSISVPNVIVVWLETLLRVRESPGFPLFSSVNLGKCWVGPHITLCPLPLTSFPIYYLLIILSPHAL